MREYVLKVLISAAVVVAVTELSKRSTLLGSLLASLPFTSLLAFAFLYADTKDTGRVADLSTGIFWLVLPSLVLFLLFPFLLRHGWPFAGALAASSLATALAYSGTVWALAKLG
ncbi:MAG: DUF3147 family protein [Polyangiales bacterium]